MPTNPLLLLFRTSLSIQVLPDEKWKIHVYLYNVRQEKNEKCVVVSSYINLLIVVQRKSRQNCVFTSVEGREELNRVCFLDVLLMYPSHT